MTIRKLSISLLASIILTAVAIYSFSGILLQKISWKLIGFAADEFGGTGINLKDPFFQAVRISSLNSITWKNVSAFIKTGHDGTFDVDRDFFINMGRVTLSLRNIFAGSFLFNIDALTLGWQKGAGRTPSSIEKSEDRLDGGLLTIPFRLNILSRRKAGEQLRDLCRDLSLLLKHGKTPVPIKFSAVISFMVHQKPLKARLTAIKEGKEYILIMNEADAQIISVALKENLEDVLTDTEVAVLYRHPLRAPKLLRIRDYAASRAEGLAAANPGLAEDTYRHILWSYLLTKTYGPDFAGMVTDAHEAGARYALAGYEESSLAERAMNDPDVIRAGDQVSGGAP